MVDHDLDHDLSARMREYYSSTHEYFEHIRCYHGHDYFDSLTRALRRARVALAGRTILDLGSGTGEILGVLKRDYGASFTGVGADISLIGCRMQEHGFPVNADAKRLPFRDETFDLVILSDVLEHIPAPQAALAEAHRVAQRGGHVLLRTPNYRCPALGQYSWRRLDRCLAGVLAARPHSLDETPELQPVLEAGKVGGDADACSAIMADALWRSCRALGGQPVAYETWAGLGWRIPLLRVFNWWPVIRHIGGTCTILYRKTERAL
ncbi:MAG TPA: class I SAM-dependent methyltransferase [Thermomicrobiales bacterium]|nr:class I SAM-dependent methyltransferase [Thermomicrobiales bacterium]